jgi:hypothetical protein
MRIEMAHLQTQGISFAVFSADAQAHSNQARQALLSQLMAEARRNRLRVDKAALMYREGGQTRFFGTPDLVKFLARQGGVRRWTHTLDL